MFGSFLAATTSACAHFLSCIYVYLLDKFNVLWLCVALSPMLQRNTQHKTTVRWIAFSMHNMNVEAGNDCDSTRRYCETGRPENLLYKRRKAERGSYENFSCLSVFATISWSFLCYSFVVVVILTVKGLKAAAAIKWSSFFFFFCSLSKFCLCAFINEEMKRKVKVAMPTWSSIYIAYCHCYLKRCAVDFVTAPRVQLTCHFFEAGENFLTPLYTVFFFNFVVVAFNEACVERVWQLQRRRQSHRWHLCLYDATQFISFHNLSLIKVNGC